MTAPKAKGEAWAYPCVPASQEDYEAWAAAWSARMNPYGWEFGALVSQRPCSPGWAQLTIRLTRKVEKDGDDDDNAVVRVPAG